jgi:UDP-glucose 4-epimerase
LATHTACATGTLNVLNTARHVGVRRVVYAASSSAYGDLPYRCKRETDLPMPLSPYAAAKLAGELYCQAFAATYGLETVGIRYFNVFGPRQDPNSPYSAVIPLFITRILAGQPPIIFGDGRQTRDFTYIANVIHANQLAADAPDAVGKTINAATGESISLLQLLEHLQMLLGKHVPPEFQPARAGDVRDSLADITLARQLLGYEPLISFVDGLKKSIDYYRSSSG